MAVTETQQESVLMDAGVFIGALTARRVHDARHAATALVAGITSVYTYDIEDRQVFEADGLHIVGPPTTMARMAHRAHRTESRTGTTEGS